MARPRPSPLPSKPVREVTVFLTQAQAKAWAPLLSPDDVAVLYGGAKGGAKTFLLCVWALVYAESLIQRWGLTPSTTPLPVGFLGRKRSVDFRKTTLETWKRVIPPEKYRLHDNEHELIIMETVKILCGGLDDQQHINKFNSAEFAFFGIDQAEETERHDVDVLQAALRLTVGGVTPAYKQLFTANPSDGWLKQDFITAPKPQHVFIPAKYTDNPHLPVNYRQTLEAAFGYNDPLLRAYRDGDWSALEASNTLLTQAVLARVQGVQHHPTEIRRVVSCDPSLGGDECVIVLVENGRIVEQQVHHERDPMKIAGYMQILAHRTATPHYATDTTGGLGEAINARLRELHPTAWVRSVNASEAADDPEHYANVRAEMWWAALRAFQDQTVPYPEDEELRRQLTAVRFKVVNSNGKIQLEPKTETKTRLGRSPDRADAYVQALYILPQTPPILQRDRWAEPVGRGEVGVNITSAMAA